MTVTQTDSVCEGIYFPETARQLRDSSENYTILLLSTLKSVHWHEPCTKTIISEKSKPTLHKLVAQPIY